MSTQSKMVIKSYGFIDHCFESQIKFMFHAQVHILIANFVWSGKQAYNEMLLQWLICYNGYYCLIWYIPFSSYQYVCYDECPSPNCGCFYHFSHDMNIIFCGWMSVSNGQAVVRRFARVTEVTNQLLPTTQSWNTKSEATKYDIYIYSLVQDCSNFSALLARLRNIYIYGLVQDCRNSNALAMVLLQPCTKPSICAMPNKICTRFNCFFVYGYIITPGAFMYCNYPYLLRMYRIEPL